MIRNILVLIFLFTCNAALYSQELPEEMLKPATANARAPKFKFINGDSFDFGNLMKGSKVHHKFEFINVGKEPLIIQVVTANCGCTVSEWTKKPVLPGQKGAVDVTFSAEGTTGFFAKKAFIQSNAATEIGLYELTIRGTVMASVGTLIK